MPKNRIEIIDNTGESPIYTRHLTIYIPGPLLPGESVKSPQVYCTNIIPKEISSKEAVSETSLPQQAEINKWDTASISYKLAYYLIKKYNCKILFEGVPATTNLIDAIDLDGLTYSEYPIDYITTGGFGGVYYALADCAATRKDCAYLADHTNITFSSTDEYVKLLGTEAPQDWLVAEGKYFIYVPETATYNSVPVGEAAPEWVPNTYYEKFVSSATGDPYYLLMQEPDPEDWAENYTLYYTKTTTEAAYNDIHNIIPIPTYEADKYFEKVTITTSRQYCDAVRNQFEDVFDSATNDVSIYASGFTPWFNINPQVVNIDNKNTFSKVDVIPGSFGYLFAYCKAIQDNPLWFASAGPERGIIAELKTPVVKYNRLDVEILQSRASTGAVALDGPQDNVGIAINPIANIRPFGYLLYGNRTLRYNSEQEGSDIGELKATSFLNIRNLVSLIARSATEAAERYKFDQNNSILYTKFSSVLKPVLDGAVSGSGILGYRLSKVATTKKARLKVKLIVVPIEAVEDLDLTIELADSLDISVNE